MNLHKLIARNAFASFTRHCFNIGIILYLTPFVIKSIGNSTYGLWSVILAVAGYSGLLDVGISTATIKLATEYRAKKMTDYLYGIITSAVSFFFVLGITCAILCSLFLPKYILSLDELKMHGEMAYVIAFVIGIDIIFVFLKNIFSGIILSFHAYHIKSIIDVLTGTMRVILTIVLLNMGYGMFGLAITKLITSFISAVITFFVCRTKLKDYHFSFDYVSMKYLKELFVFGGKIFYMTMMIRFNNVTTPVIIASTIGAVWNAYYSVANRFATYIDEIVWSIHASFMPLFSELSAAGEKGIIQETYINYTRYVLVLIMPIYFGIILLGPGFLGIWIGPEYQEKAGLALVLIASGSAIRALKPLWARLLIGSGDLNFYAKITSVGFLIKILVAIPAAYLYGINGVAAIGVGVNTVLIFAYLVYMDFHFKVSAKKFVISCYVRLVPSLCVYTMCYFIVERLYPTNSYLNIFIKGFLMLLSYLPVAALTMLNKNEKIIIANILKKMMAKLFRRALN